LRDIVDTIYPSGLCRVMESLCGFGSEIPDPACKALEYHAT
jgi:hypothetical protein